MIKQLQQKVAQQSAQLDGSVAEYHDTLSSLNVIEDPEFQAYLEQNSPQDNGKVDLEQSEKSMSISALNESINSLSAVSTTLNDLWVVKGLIQEIESFIAIQQDSLDYEVTDFDYLHSNLVKLNDKIACLDGKLFVKSELLNKQQDLVKGLKQLFESIWRLYFPSFTQYVLLVSNISLVDFIGILNKFGQLNELISVNEFLSPYQLKWENYLLDIPGQQLRFSSDGHSYNLTVSTESSGDRLTGNLESIQSFIEFIGAINILSLKNYYQLKLSNKLINIISEEINVLMNDAANNNKLIQIINTLSDHHWSLSIDLTSKNYTEKLQQIYNNWLVDNYIDKIRNQFKTTNLDLVHSVRWKITNTLTMNDFEQKLNDMEKKIDSMSIERTSAEPPESAEPADQDGWDEGWNEEWNEDQPLPIKERVEPKQDEATEEDGWGDWNDWDENEPKSPVKQQQPQPQAQQPQTQAQAQSSQTQSSTEPIETQIQISDLPNHLLETINDFQIESVEDIDILVSTILSLSTITYPHLTSSYLMYNDLQYLGKNLSNNRLMTFSESLIKRQQTEISQQLTMILIKIKFTDDSVDPNHMVYKLVDNWYKEKFSGNLQDMNYYKFKQLMIYSIDLINNWIINLILSTKDISENKSDQFNKLINNHQTIFRQYLEMLQEDLDKLDTVNKVNNFKFLINNHLVDIIERFYQGEFYDLTTDELISTIQSCFIKSDLRDNYINEIIEFRNIN